MGNKCFSDEKLRNIQLAEVELLDEMDRICNKYNLTYYICYGTLLGAVRHKGFIPWDDDIDIVMPRKDFEEFVSIAPNQVNDNYCFQYFNTDSNYLDPSAKLRHNEIVYAPRDHKRFNYLSLGCWIDIFPLDNLKSKNSFLCFLQAVFNKHVIERFVHNRMLRDFSGLKLSSRIVAFLARLFPASFWFNLRNSIYTLEKSTDSKYVTCFPVPYDSEKAIYERTLFGKPCKIEFEGKYYWAPEHWDALLKQVYGDYMSLPPVEQRICKHADNE